MSTLKNLFSLFCFIPVLLPPSPISPTLLFPLGVRSCIAFSTAIRYLSHQRPGILLPEHSTTGMWHLFSFQWVLHVLDLIHIVLEHLGGRLEAGYCITWRVCVWGGGHSEEKGDERSVCVYVRGGWARRKNSANHSTSQSECCSSLTTWFAQLLRSPWLSLVHFDSVASCCHQLRIHTVPNVLRERKVQTRGSKGNLLCCVCVCVPEQWKVAMQFGDLWI